MSTIFTSTSVPIFIHLVRLALRTIPTITLLSLGFFSLLFTSTLSARPVYTLSSSTAHYDSSSHTPAHPHRDSDTKALLSWRQQQQQLNIRKSSTLPLPFLLHMRTQPNPQQNNNNNIKPSPSASPTTKPNPQTWRQTGSNPNPNPPVRTPSPSPSVWRRQPKPKPSSRPPTNSTSASQQSFDAQCPTAECKARLTDCVSCLSGISLNRCRRFTRLTFGILRKWTPDQNQRLRERRALSKLLLRATPKSDSTYCEGFVNTYARAGSLNIGSVAKVNTVGLGIILQEELNDRFGQRTVSNVTSFVIYRNIYTLINSTTNANGSGNSATATTKTSTTTKNNGNWKKNNKNNASVRRLYGRLRLPTTSKHVIKADGTLRIWKIRQILRTLPKRQNWANVFQTEPKHFRVEVDKQGRTFLVFINFASRFTREH